MPAATESTSDPTRDATAAPLFHAVTLSFLDPDQERLYTEELAPRALAQLQIATFASAVIWMIGGLVYAQVASPAFAFAISGSMVAANLLALALMRRFNRYNQLQVIVVAFTSSATVAALLLSIGGDRFVAYAAPSVMLIAVFAFLIIQLRFVFAAVAAVIYLALFVGFSIGSGSTETVTLVQTFLVASALFPSAFGVRALELANRNGFHQRLQISSLADQVERLLRSYLSPGVAEVVLADPNVSELGGRVEEVSVLFADLQGFTPMSQRMPPEQVAELLNRYFEVVVPTVLEEGGSVLSFDGDAVVAVFNAPNSCPDHPFKACRAALRIQSAISRLRSEEGLEEAPPFRIGVNTGDVLVGNVGSAEMRTFTVIGDAVNLASRLQTHAEPGSVLIGPATYERVETAVDARITDPVLLKGMSEPIRPYELLALAGNAV
ncbi:MAG: adenylate/guanylate cyclase domain-containing protein [Acidimicrobiia bacterium]